MQRAESDSSVSQVINWYLVQAGKGGHRDSREPENEAKLKSQWRMSAEHLSRDFRVRPFKDLNALEMQSMIDNTAASGAENAANWLREIFEDVDKFAVRQGVIPGVRAKRLMSPNAHKDPKPLNDAAFKNAWEALSYCGNGGAMVDRGPCLAILLSGVTLQPLGSLISMRRGDVDAERKLWVSSDPSRYVYLSDLALDLISKAIELGDLIHREAKTAFVFPSGGPKRDAERPLSFSLTFDVMRRYVDKVATPHDLRQTGLASLKGLGGEELKALVKAISSGGLETVPNGMQVALIEGWAERVRDITKRTWS